MRKEKLLFAFALIAVSVSAAAQEGVGPIKIAIVDMNRVVMESALGKESQAVFEEFYRGKLNEIQQEGQALERERATLDNQRSVLSEEAYTNRRNELQQRLLAFQQKQEAAEREVNKLRQDETRKFIQQVIPIIQEIGSEGGYTLILDRNADGVLYFHAAVDISNEVLQRLDSKLQAGG